MNRKLIPNVPVFGYDGNNAGFFNTLLQAALRCVGEEHNRAKLTALSGEGNRFCWRDGKWQGGCETSEAINETPFETERRVLEAIGWQADYITVSRDEDGNYINTDPARIRRDFTESIDRGYPIIARLLKHPESNLNLFFGYEDGGEMIVSYDYTKDFEPGVSKPNEYATPVAQANWEDNIAGYVLLKGKTGAVSERDTALSAFGWISRHARWTGEIKGNLVGFAAWEAWIRLLESDDFTGLDTDEVWRRFGPHCDAVSQIHERKAALPYYRSLAEAIPEWREGLEIAVNALEACLDNLGNMWANDVEEFRDLTVRKRFAEAGRECMRKDMEAVEQFEKLLNSETLK